MPSAEVRFVKGDLSDSEIAEIASGLTATIMRHQGARPDSAAARNVTCVEFLELESSRWYVGGNPTPAPRVRITVTVPYGSLGPEGRRELVREATALILDVMGARIDEYGVWCLVNEVQQDAWGTAGRIWTWREIVMWVARRDVLAKRERQRLDA